MYAPEQRSRGFLPDYRTIWRWHFYAGLFCLPFVVILSISGALYLFKAEIESWIDQPYDQLQLSGHPASAEAQAKAALAAFPGSTLQSYELPQSENQAIRVLVNNKGVAERVYLHPESLAVLNTVTEDSRLMRRLFRLHGELWMGNQGSMLVELAASWTIIMVLTGLVLWWPRGEGKLAGVLYPRFGRGDRIFWRDIHSVTGMWISGFTLILLLTGLPWAKFWGDYFKTVRRLTGTAVVQQDWTNGATSSAVQPESGGGTGGEHSGHGSANRPMRSPNATPLDLSALDRVVNTVKPLNLPAPVLIAPPGSGKWSGGGGTGGGGNSGWTAKSMTANRPYRVDLVVEGDTGTIKSRKDFSDKHVIDKVVGTGTALHEGRLFGWPNQLLGLLTALGLVTLSVSSVVLWWRRRESRTLGAPARMISRPVSTGLLLVIVLLGLYLPLFGVSLIGVLLAEFLFLRRVPSLRDWLGLTPPAARNSEATLGVRT